MRPSRPRKRNRVERRRRARDGFRRRARLCRRSPHSRTRLLPRRTSEPAHGLLVVADEQVLGLAVVLEHHRVVLATDAGSSPGGDLATSLVQTDLLSDIQQFGAADIAACFSCGTCTATCPLSDNDATFPRSMIRYAQVGMRTELLSSKELWTCDHCGLCSDSCPTEADPGEFMAAARRYAIASDDSTGLARILYTRPVVGSLVAVAVEACFAVFMYASPGPQDEASLALFTFVPDAVIRRTGIVVMAVMVLAAVVGITRMATEVARREGVTVAATSGSSAHAFSS